MPYIKSTKLAKNSTVNLSDDQLIQLNKWCEQKGGNPLLNSPLKNKVAFFIACKLSEVK